MLANITKFGQTAAQKAAKLAESVTSQSRIHQEYSVGPQVGSAGPCRVWKIHRATKKSAGENVPHFFMPKSARRSGARAPAAARHGPDGPFAANTPSASAAPFTLVIKFL